MNDSKLVQILKTFSKKKLKELSLFIECPLFNSNKKQYDLICRFTTYLIKYSPSFTHKNLAKEIVYQHCFQQKEYVQKEMLYLISNTVKLVEQFILYDRMQRNKVNNHLELLKFYTEHNLSIYASSEQRVLEKIQAQSVTKDKTYFKQAFLLSEATLNLDLVRNKKRIETTQYENIIQSLDCYYLNYQLDFYTDLLNRAQILGLVPPKMPLLESFLKDTSEPVYQDVPLIILHRQAIKMLQNIADESSYYNFKQTLKELGKKNILGESVGGNLFLYAHNYCTWKINAGEQKYLNEYLDLYNMQLSNDLLLDENGCLTAGLFKNIVTVGLRAKQPEWTNNFIDAYLEKVEASLQEEVSTYNIAHLYFHQKQYDKVINTLIDHRTNQDRIFRFSDIFYQIDARKLIIKTYFELHVSQNKDGAMMEQLEKFLDNLSVFLSMNNHIISEHHLISNRHFITIIKYLYIKVYDYNWRNRKAENLACLNIVQEKINTTKPLAEARWLLEQHQCLENLINQC